MSRLATAKFAKNMSINDFSSNMLITINISFDYK